MPEITLDELARKGEAALSEANRMLTDVLGERIPVEHDRVLKLVDDTFDAMELVVKNQRAFAHSVVDSVFAQLTPAAPAKPDATRKPAARKATRKPTTRKATTRKATARKRAAKIAAS